MTTLLAWAPIRNAGPAKYRLNEANLRRYVREDDRLRIAPVPALYFSAIDRLVSQHDLVILVEGSTYMDTWGSALLWAFLWGTSCARRRNKPCLAYAVDAGQLRPYNQRLLGLASCQPDAVITRNEPAARRLRSWGVKAPIEVTADNAFRYQPDPADLGWYLRDWPEARNGVVGLAAVDFSLWPVVMRPWGRKERCYRWPYYFSHSPARTRQSEGLADGFAALADEITETYGRQVALICMEQVDEPLARRIHGRMRHAERARVFSAREHDASRMTALLRSLDYLVTSRYHAAVLSLPAQVPQVAVGHDLRLADLHGEMGLGNEFFVSPADGEMFGEIRERLARLAADPARISHVLRRGYQEHLVRATRNRELLRGFLVARGWSVES
ncbi:MAG: polysaccharide pyruvyl transferase family protein [Bacteroidota bacterium]